MWKKSQDTLWKEIPEEITAGKSAEVLKDFPEQILEKFFLAFFEKSLDDFFGEAPVGVPGRITGKIYGNITRIIPAAFPLGIWDGIQEEPFVIYINSQSCQSVSKALKCFIEKFHWALQQQFKSTTTTIWQIIIEFSTK